MPDEKDALQRPGRSTGAVGQAVRWVGLQVDLHVPHTWFGPSWALLAGILSSGGLGFDLRSVLFAAVAWLVSDPLLGSLLAVSLDAAKARHSCTRPPLPPARWSLPYVQAGSPGQRLLDALAARAARLKWHWEATEGGALRWLLLAFMGLVMGAVAGPGPFIVLTLAVLGLLGIAAGRPLHSEERDSLAAAHLLTAWLVGHSTFGPLDPGTVLVGLGFATIWYAWTRQPPLLRLLAVAHVLVAGLLAALRAPLAAGGVLLLAVPLVVLVPENGGRRRSYLQHTQAFLMASMLLAACGLVWPL